MSGLEQGVGERSRAAVAEVAWGRSAINATADAFLERVLRHRRLLLRLTLGVALITLSWTLLSHRSYTAQVSFLPADQNSGGSALAGLASQVGLNVGDGGGQDSPEFYADLLLSDRTLRELVVGRFAAVSGGQVQHDTLLVDYLYPSPADSAVRVAMAVLALRKHLTAVTSATTGVVTFNASFKDPLVAYGVTVRALALVNRFNVESRQSQAGAQRRFLESQVQSTAADLRASEDSLLRFLTRNRDYRNSPTLSFENDRLQRAVTMRQAAYSQVFQSYLQAEAAEVQNTPVITVVGPPSVPIIGNARNTVVKTVLFAMIAFVLGLVYVLFRETLGEMLASNPSLASEIAAVRADLAAIGRRGRFWSGWRRPK